MRKTAWIWLAVASRGRLTPRSASACTPPPTPISPSCWRFSSESRGCSTAANPADCAMLCREREPSSGRVRRRLHQREYQLGHCLHLALGRALAAGDNDARVAHAAARRRRLAGDEAHQLLRVRLDQLRCLLLVRCPPISPIMMIASVPGIVIQQSQRIDMHHANDGIAARCRSPSTGRCRASSADTPPHTSACPSADDADASLL